MLDTSKADGDIKDIEVYSPDRCHHFLNGLVSKTAFLELHFITGKGKVKWTIGIRVRYLAVGSERSKGLLSLHVLLVLNGKQKLPVYPRVCDKALSKP